ncbi:hypothetical protein JQN72_01385 [Phycicoccus sp. CSK15P-2]|uniref:DUF7847 domain-containing protein n=1 Tax=Phycicoccus sp. CSK15P-2 TaxID=2807627 RepID=UPI00195032C4|nr:hypothetical protein [Phycicoccus sp. CSK15P-2]MBM6402899.1 hypothetical protein [Phycicoccus sp. CSK15P-2]
MSDQPWVAPGSGVAQPPAPPAPYAPPPPPGAGPGPAPAGHLPPPPGAPTAAPYARMDVRPGIIPLRPLALGDLYGAVLKAVRGNPGATIGLATLTSFAFLLPTTALGTWLASQSEITMLETGSSGASDTFPDGFGLGIVGMYLPYIGQLLSAILLAGFLAQVVGQAVLGRKVGMGGTWRATRSRVPALVGAVLVSMLAGVVVLGGLVGLPLAFVIAVGASDDGSIALAALLILGAALVAFLVLGYLSTAWAFATPAIVLERVGVVHALRRSMHLVGSPLKGPFWRVLGIRLLTGIIVGVAGSVITMPISFALMMVMMVTVADDPSGGNFFVLQTVTAGIAALITGALTTPFSAGIDALLYVDGRIRSEGLDVQLVQTAQGAAPPPWPVTTS